MGFLDSFIKKNDMWKSPDWRLYDDMRRGLKDIDVPEVKKTELLEDDMSFAQESYLKKQARKKGFENTIITGNRTPKLASITQLG